MASYSEIYKSNLQDVLTVNKVEDLLSFPGSDNDICIVTDENRGGIFIYNNDKNTINDEGITFNGWIRQYEGPVNVKWFGAIGNGYIDDTNAIKKAISFGDDIMIPKGKFKITNTLSLNYGQSIIGDSPNSSYIYVDTNANAIESIGNGLYNEVELDEDITTWQNYCKVKDTVDFKENYIVKLFSSVDSLTEDAGSMQLGFRQNDDQRAYFAEYLHIRNIDSDNNKIIFTEDTIFKNYPKDDSKLYMVRFNKCSIKNIHFVKKSGDANFIYFEYNESSIVENCIFAHNSFAGAAVYDKWGYSNSIKNNTTYLDASTCIKFGELNSDCIDYYRFNTFKVVSSQNCNILENNIHNGTQCIDITYVGSNEYSCPSMFTTIRGNIMHSPRFNMATSHWGCFGNIFDSNTGNYCQEGIATRSRNDVVINNVIIGSREVDKDTAEKASTSYGVYMGTGWTVNGNISNNVIHGFFTGIYCTQSTYGGFAYQRIKITNNEIRYCTYGTRVNRYDNNSLSKTDKFEAYINGNYFKAIEKASLLIYDKFTNGIQFTNNTIVDTPSIEYPIIYIKENSKDIVISNNIFPKYNDDYFIHHCGLTEDEDGNDISEDETKNNYIKAELIVRDNIIRSGEYEHASNAIYFYNETIGYRNLTHSYGSDYKKFYDEDVDLYLTANIMNLSYDSDNLDDVNIHNIYPTMEGATCKLFGTDHIHLKDDGNIVLAGETNIDLASNKMLSLTFYNDKWYIE